MYISALIFCMYLVLKCRIHVNLAEDDLCAPFHHLPSTGILSQNVLYFVCRNCSCNYPVANIICAAPSLSSGAAPLRKLQQFARQCTCHAGGRPGGAALVTSSHGMQLQRQGRIQEFSQGV